MLLHGEALVPAFFAHLCRISMEGHSDGFQPNSDGLQPPTYLAVASTSHRLKRALRRWARTSCRPRRGRPCVCVCVCQALFLRVVPFRFVFVCFMFSCRGAVDHYHSLPNEDSDRSVVKQCGTPHCVPAEFSTSCHPTFPRFDSWSFMILPPNRFPSTTFCH